MNAGIKPAEVEALVGGVKSATGLSGYTVDAHVAGSVDPQRPASRGDKVWRCYEKQG